MNSLTQPSLASLATQPAPPIQAVKSFSALDRFLRTRLLAKMAHLRQGRLTLTDALGTIHLGTPEGISAALTVHLHVSDPGFYRAVASGGSVGAGEAYMAGMWTCDKIAGLMQLLVRNRDLLDGLETGWAKLGGVALRAWQTMQPNTRAGARRHIAAHYDLSNAFFGLFLSPDLMYSSALWDGEADTLEQASERKLARVCQLLDLQASDTVIEIGTGWGGFALYAAQHHGCHITTTTISQAQYDLAVARIEAAGLGDRITVRLDDYRDLTGHYDKCVSIEMVEAIGANQMSAYFSKIGQLLKPTGVALIQAITIEDHRYKQALQSVDFIKRHVFPGSFIPSIAALLSAKAQSSDLGVLSITDFGPSYARTLQAWRQRFLAQREAVRALGFDESFLRMWEFYLAYCEGGFSERSIGVAHLLLAKPEHRVSGSCLTARQAI